RPQGARRPPLPRRPGAGGGRLRRLLTPDERRALQPRHQHLQLGRDRLDGRPSQGRSCRPAPGRPRAGGGRLQRLLRPDERRGLQPPHPHPQLRPGPRPWRAPPLASGRVPGARGVAPGPSPLASAEVFAPAANTFSSAGIGSMGTPRAAAAAALLPDGRVLVAGGFNGSSVQRSAEAFNPATNTFSSAEIGLMGKSPRFAAPPPPPDRRGPGAGGRQRRPPTLR